MENLGDKKWVIEVSAVWALNFPKTFITEVFAPKNIEL